MIIFLTLLLFVSCNQTQETKISSVQKEKVSVICPTYDRQNRHENLYKAFKQQTYPNKELLVLDDSPTPSKFFLSLNDPNVHYQNLTTRLSIGSKRNMLIEKAQGSLIAHFDDDDYYAPNYLETMIQSLGAADLIKLSKWLIWREYDGTLWEWDTRFFDHFHYVISGNSKNAPKADATKNPPEELEAYKETNIWGFGFSYVYKKSLWQENPFNDQNLGEDYQFISKAKQNNKSLIHMPDDHHMVVHTMHRLSTTSKMYPQLRIETSQITQLLGENAFPWLIIDN
jgi:glycosyltransferase involved in cell wall biosynthesis